MPKLDDRIQTLEAKLKQLKVQQQRHQTRAKAIVSRRERNDDVRRKILVGAVLLTRVEQGHFDRALLLEWLSTAITRTEDRVLFELAAADSGAK